MVGVVYTFFNMAGVVYTVLWSRFLKFLNF